MQAPSEATVAGGNISPNRFVKRSAVGKVIQTVAGEVTCGISGYGTHTAPYGALDDGYHAVAGENCRVFFPGEVTEIIAGTGGTTVNAFLTSDINGAAVITVTDKAYYGAVALSAAAAGERVLVRVASGYLSV